VYIQTINQFLTEYLVDYDLLVDRLGKYGIQPLEPKDLAKYNLKSSSGMFSDLFNDMVEYSSTLPPNHSDHIWIEKATKMTNAEFKLSSLNRWFAFTKA
jgi:hypothetical protein